MGGSLQTSFWLMVALQTIGSVDMPGKGARKLPSPRQYLAILVAWLVLGIAADISERAAKPAAMFGWLLVLAGMVAGPFGSRAVSLMNTVSGRFGVPPAPAAASAAGVSRADVLAEIATAGG
jgi:hypothetical protein